jgi:hypothetical protein
MKRRTLLALVAVAACLAFVLAGSVVQAQTPAPVDTSASSGGLIDRLSPDCADFGTCDFCDVLDGFAILTRWILGISGAVALVMFVWFGFRFIISAGRSDAVSGAKRGLVGTVIGLAIVFGAWEIINLVLYATITSSSASDINSRPALSSVILFRFSSSTSVAPSPWNEYCAGRPKPVGSIPGVTDTQAVP